MAVEIIFVTGAPRSGTTLLAGCLSRFPAFPYLPECAVLTDLVRERLRSGAEQHPLKFKAFYGNAERADRLYRNLVAEMLTDVVGEARHDEKEKRYLVLKDPYLLFYLDVLPDLMPWPVRTICIVRDPLDTVASFLRVRKREGVAMSIDEAIGFELPFYLAAAAAREREDARHPKHFVRYEDFVGGNPMTLAQLERAVGFAVRLDEHRGISQELLDADSAWHTKMYEQPVSKSRVGEYLDVISDADAILVTAAFSDVMHRLTASAITADA